jgi:hypothetical protein
MEEYRDEGCFLIQVPHGTESASVHDEAGDWGSSMEIVRMPEDWPADLAFLATRTDAEFGFDSLVYEVDPGH